MVSPELPGTPSGPYTRAVIDFDQYGRKTIILEFVRLELMA
jgi:hypothetical protein